MEDSLQRSSGTPSVRVLDLSWQGLLNPIPISREEDETLVDEYLSPSRLKALTGNDNLQDVTTLQMCVDTRERTLGNFGTQMPNLRELKLNNSVIMSIRDLGTSLSHLQVLWMARCSLTDLDGISSFSSLMELYLAYNDLQDLSQVSMLENLEILDLEGNNLDDINELQYLALCSKLTKLTVEGNPICARPRPEDTESSDYNYRVVVRRTIPQLQYLDDAPADEINPNTQSVPNQDWLTVLDSIKESVGSLASVDSGSAQRRTAMRPSTAVPVLSRRPHSAPRPSSAGRIVSNHSSAKGSVLQSFVDSPVEDEASDLTHGVCKVICGNPIKALRARKEKLEDAHGSSVPPEGLKPEVSLDSITESQKDRDDVFTELKAWRERHHDVLQRIKEERAPQVFTITHSDEEGRESLSSSSEDEDLEDTWDSRCLIRESPETAIHSPRSPKAIPHCRETSLESSPRQPSPPMTPCPPGSIGINPRLNKGADIRARHLHRVFTPSKTTALKATATITYMGDEAFLPSDIDDHVIRTQTVIQPTSTPLGELNRRFATGPGQLERNSSRPTFAKFLSSHQPVIRSSIKTLAKPSPPHAIRPITATGILQRLPNRPILLTTSKTSSA